MHLRIFFNFGLAGIGSEIFGGEKKKMVKRSELEQLVKEKILLVGEAGTGKTYTAVRVAEEVARQGKKVVFIDPEYGSQRLLLQLDDDILDMIDLKVTTTWETFESEVMAMSDCYIKIVDGISEAFELMKRYLEERFIAQGSYMIGETEVEIKDKDLFTLPWNQYARVYDAVRAVIYEMLKPEHNYHLLFTMHPLVAIGGSDARKRLEGDIYRKFDTVLEMFYSVGGEGKIEWKAHIVKNRGHSENIGKRLVNPHVSLVRVFKKRMGVDEGKGSAGE